MAAKDCTNIIGKKFNLLTIICEAPKHPGNSNRRVSALCDCGNAGTFVRSEVIHGKTKSCGCLHAGPVTHGHTKRKKMSPEYYSWASMRSRCTNKNLAAYPQYGGRGIKIAPQWASFECFLSDMGARPEGTSLERINHDGNYEPSNCRWASRTDQSNNRRSNALYEHDGTVRTLAQWAQHSGIAYNTLHARVTRFKWPLGVAMTKPPRRSRYTV
jgi:hypothetical protein